MKFGYVILYVDNVEATLEFYERAFCLERRMLDDTKNYGELETGGTRLAFAANELVRNMIPVDFVQSGPNKPASLRVGDDGRGRRFRVSSGIGGRSGRSEVSREETLGSNRWPRPRP